MKQLALTVLLTGALAGAIDHGYVENAAEVRVDSGTQRVAADVFEHSVKPQTASQLLIRVDDGRAVILRPEESQHFRPGDRVRILWDDDSTRVERE